MFIISILSGFGRGKIMANNKGRYFLKYLFIPINLKFIKKIKI